MIDLDAYEERAAIIEFDGGLSRFQAETLAAKEQGAARHEVIAYANGQRDTKQAQHQREASQRHRQGEVS